MGSKSLISLSHVCAGYDGREVLSDATLEVKERDFVGVVGPNGGGKTTLIRVMLGLLPPMSGRVGYGIGTGGGARLRMGYLPQQSELDGQFPISARDVVLSGLLAEKPARTHYSRGDKERAEAMLAYMGLEGIGRQNFGTLSGGQRQRVLIARAMVAEPAVLILDEPTAYIDGGSTCRLYDLLGRLNERCAVVMVSHDVGTVLRNVRNIVCVNRRVHYHAVEDVDEAELSEVFGCPFDVIAHGHLPHRVLGEHER